MHFVLVSMFNFIRTFCNKPHFLNALELEGYVLDSVPQYVRRSDWGKERKAIGLHFALANLRCRQSLEDASARVLGVPGGVRGAAISPSSHCTAMWAHSVQGLLTNPCWRHTIDPHLSHMSAPSSNPRRWSPLQLRDSRSHQRPGIQTTHQCPTFRRSLWCRHSVGCQSGAVVAGTGNRG